MNVDAILLVSYGGPEGEHEVMPFLQRVVGDQDVSSLHLDHAARRYQALDGVSPINDENRSLIRALRAELSQRGREIPIHWGNLYSDPYLPDAIANLHRQGRRNVLAITTRAYSAYGNCRRYREALHDATITAGADEALHLTMLPPHGHLDAFARTFADGITKAVSSLVSDGVGIDRSRVLFTTRDLPAAQAATSGPQALQGPGMASVYVHQHVDVIRRVMENVADHLAKAPTWSLAFHPQRVAEQPEAGLAPSIADELGRARSDGMEAVVFAPIGFTSECMEITWDLDREAADRARALGMRPTRVATPGDSYAYVRALVDLIEDVIGDRGRDLPAPWGGLCGTGCCTRAGDDRPAVPAPARSR